MGRARQEGGRPSASQGALTRNQALLHLQLGLPASGTVKNKYLLLEPRGLQDSVGQPEQSVTVTWSKSLHLSELQSPSLNIPLRDLL